MNNSKCPTACTFQEKYYAGKWVTTFPVAHHKISLESAISLNNLYYHSCELKIIFSSSSSFPFNWFHNQHALEIFFFITFPSDPYFREKALSGDKKSEIASFEWGNSVFKALNSREPVINCVFFSCQSFSKRHSGKWEALQQCSCHLRKSPKQRQYQYQSSTSMMIFKGILFKCHL
jgi:hypothetical protein